MVFQFSNFWNLQKVNDFGNLDYHEFLRKYCLDPPAGTNQRRLATPLVTSRSGSMMSGRQSMLSRVSRRCFTSCYDCDVTGSCHVIGFFLVWDEFKRFESTVHASCQRRINRAITATTGLNRDVTIECIYDVIAFLRHFVFYRAGAQTLARYPERMSCFGSRQQWRHFANALPR